MHNLYNNSTSNLIYHEPQARNIYLCYENLFIHLPVCKTREKERELSFVLM